MRVWQRLSGDEWVFGEKVRGIVRKIQGELYFNSKLEGPKGGWVWFVNNRRTGLIKSRGIAATLTDAVECVEKELRVNNA